MNFLRTITAWDFTAAEFFIFKAKIHVKESNTWSFSDKRLSSNRKYKVI
jgi:hypothetical protein